ncbi:MAG: hypothetical protein IK020_04845 [Clostridiales bacterium]|nr:hypothetical protein [Clostridiales bacterium]
MPSLTSVKYSNKKVMRIVRIAAVCVAAAALLGFLIYYLLTSGIFYKKTDTDGKSYELTEKMQTAVKESDLQQGYMFSRTVKLLMEDRGMDPWVLSWYVIPGTTRSVPAMESAYVDTMDQVLLLASYIKEGKKSKAESLIKAIDASLTNENGMLVAFAEADKLITGGRTKEERSELYEDPVYLQVAEAPVSMAATTEYLGVLMDYYDKWGKAETLDRIRDLSAKVMESGYEVYYRAADQLAMPTPIPVTEKSLVTPVPEETSEQDDIVVDTKEEGGEKEEAKLVSLSGIELASMDLDAMRRASVLLPKYQEKYENIVSIVRDGKISETLPLYAWIYTDNGYMYYTGSDGNVDLVASLYVMVHLAEIGQLDADAYAWVSEQIYNNGFLYESYNIMSGLAGSDVEASEAYPLVLYLAKIKGDDDLFAATYSAMTRNYATLSTSPALYTFFRNVENSRIAVCARENLLMELLLE